MSDRRSCFHTYCVKTNVCNKKQTNSAMINCTHEQSESVAMLFFYLRQHGLKHKCG